MNLLQDEEMNDLIEYVNEIKQVSIPQIQSNFGWSYPKAKQGVDKLIMQGTLKFKKGNVFALIESNRTSICDLNDFDFEKIRDRKYERLLFEQLDFRKGGETLFDLSQEQNKIKSYIELMERLILCSLKLKKPKSVAVTANGKLPFKYSALTNVVKQLVDFAIKFSSTKKVAKFGLTQSCMHWKSGSLGYSMYTQALNFISDISDREFMTIKQHLAVE